MTNSKKKENFQINWWSWFFIFCAGFCILFSLIAPWLFTSYSLMDFSSSGGIGDTIGGIMNPFIAIAGAILTFLAFFMQFRANQLQIEKFSEQLEQDKSQFQNQLLVQKNQFLKSQIEGQFYEMIKLHKENVNEISMDIFTGNFKKEKNIYGRKVFRHYISEIHILYELIRKNHPNKSKDLCIHLAYHYFFNGLNMSNENSDSNKDPYKSTISDIAKVNVKTSSQFGQELPKDVIAIFSELNPKLENWPKHEIVKGQSNYLGHYYRHLFQTVKFMANQEEGLMDYSEKRKYLRFLRAQLSNEEQVLLFYNWKSGYGEKWENINNRFFTDYRMIHNLRNDLILLDFDLSNEFNLTSKNDYKIENNRIDDFIFEFQKV